MVQRSIGLNYPHQFELKEHSTTVQWSINRVNNGHVVKMLCNFVWRNFCNLELSDFIILRKSQIMLLCWAVHTEVLVNIKSDLFSYSFHDFQISYGQWRDVFEELCTKFIASHLLWGVYVFIKFYFPLHMCLIRSMICRESWDVHLTLSGCYLYVNTLIIIPLCPTLRLGVICHFWSSRLSISSELLQNWACNWIVAKRHSAVYGYSQ